MTYCVVEVHPRRGLIVGQRPTLDAALTLIRHEAHDNPAGVYDIRDAYSGFCLERVVGIPAASAYSLPVAERGEDGELRELLARLAA